jgi:hypothetical protein
MGAQGARVNESASELPVSSPCFTHPHGGGSGPRLLLHTLAGREAATVAIAAATT